ncbi:MAG: CoA transferase [Gammaproteobacteria bacterium]|jgi:crotonobetainyl-CoA:carnitine CoA-transferase CaiB-like acyl-CoA transferase|nr:CoA transferase [Gammaproteobacteria bacterium]
MTRKHVLDGVRVLDFTHVLAGPTCTRLMAETGADVIKVEAAPMGDMVRLMPALKDGRSGYYIQQNRGKQSICLNLRDPRAQEVIHKLVKDVDVVVENFTPGVMKRLNIDYATLSAINPKLIMCSISAFGQTGPLSDRPGFDYIAQAYAGVIDMIGEENGSPYFPGLGMGDVSTGAHAYGAITAALFHREKGGGGQHLDITLLDCLFHCHEINVQGYDGSNGQLVPHRSGAHHFAVAPLGMFKGKDKWLVIIAIGAQWENLLKVIGCENFKTDPRFADNAGRVKHKQVLIDAIEAWLRSTPSDEEAVRILEENHVPVAPVLSVPEAMAHPHHNERQTVRTITDRAFGKLKIPGVPLRFSAYPEFLDLQAAFLGEHNAEVLKGLGYADSDIAALAAGGVLASEPVPAASA